MTAQDRQNELLEELVNQLCVTQRQRTTELGQWKQADPRLAKGCRMAAEVLSKVQAEFLELLTDEVNSNAEELLDGEFVLNEFIDRFGPRLAHLNGVIQVLAQLSSAEPDEQRLITAEMPPIRINSLDDPRLEPYRNFKDTNRTRWVRHVRL